MHSISMNLQYIHICVLVCVWFFVSSLFFQFLIFHVVFLLFFFLQQRLPFRLHCFHCFHNNFSMFSSTTTKNPTKTFCSKIPTQQQQQQNTQKKNASIQTFLASGQLARSFSVCLHSCDPNYYHFKSLRLPLCSHCSEP